MSKKRIEVILGACLVLAPAVVAAAQGNSSDPLAPPPPNVATTPSPTSGQMTPGVPRSTNAVSREAVGQSSGGTGAESQVQMMKDRTFLKDAAQGGMAEIQLGQLAAEKASSDKVKSFGQKMVADHTVLDNDLKPFADQMGVPPPSKLKAADQAEVDKLNGLSGEAFDREYVSYMMKDHQHDLKDFRNEAVSTSDGDLRVAVEKGEGVIVQHHRMIDRIGASMGVKAAD